jgi:hypothetical protein
MELWAQLPYDIITTHILSKLPIDLRLELKLKPQKISKDIVENLHKKLQEIKSPPAIYYEQKPDGFTTFIEVRKMINKLQYSYHLYFTGDRDDEFIWVRNETTWIIWNNRRWGLDGRKWDILI